MTMNNKQSLYELLLSEVVPHRNFIFENGVYCAVLPHARYIGEQSFSHSDVQFIDAPLVEVIAKKAFEGCVSLSGVRLLKQCHVGKDAFHGCTFLANIDMRMIKNIDEWSFSGTNLRVVNLEHIAQENIPKQAFSNCHNLTFFKSNSTIIEKRAFYKCVQLQRVECGKLVRIDERAFGFCVSLSYVGRISKKTKAPPSAFADCEYFSSVSQPKTVHKTSRIREIERESADQCPQNSEDWTLGL